MTAQHILGLFPLLDRKLAHAEHLGRAIGLLALHRNKAHRQPQCHLAKRFSIGCIILLPFHERLDVGGWDEPNVMAKLAYLTAPKMNAAAGLHRDNAGLQMTEKS